MAIDANIPLQAKPIDLAAIGNSVMQGAQLKTQKVQNQLSQEELAQQKFKTINEREKSRISSTVFGATQLKPYLESGDIEGARAFLDRRKSNLEQRRAEGENIDTAETDDLLELLDKDPEKLKLATNNLIGVGQQLGILKTARELSSNIPSSIQEYEYYNGLSPEEKLVYLESKRNQFGVGNYVNNGQVNNAPGYLKTQANIEGTKQNAKNASDLAYKPEIDRRSAAAKEIGTAEGNEGKKEISAKNVIALADEAEKILPSASSGKIQTLVTGVNKLQGKSTEQSKADAQLKVISAGLTSNVPRFEGPQGVLDVELYKQAAADIGNSDLPIGDRQAALATVKKLQQKHVKPLTAIDQSPEAPLQNNGVRQSKGGVKFTVIE